MTHMPLTRICTMVLAGVLAITVPAAASAAPEPIAVPTQAPQTQATLSAVAPYESAKVINLYHIIPPYPAADTLGGAADVTATMNWLAKPGSVEWQEAADDAAAFASPVLLNFMTAGIIDRYNADNSPATLKLLDRLQASLDPIVDSAKQYFNRPRPFRALHLPATCDNNYAPTAAPEVGMHDSYPSGHATRGWLAALVLTEIAPDKAVDWLTRGQEFGDSRVACGVHYPSDVAAGRLLAQASFDAIKTDEAFQIDLNAAQLEYRRLQAKYRNGE